MAIKLCSECKGKGVIMVVTKFPSERWPDHHGAGHEERECPECKGTGLTPSQCPKCHYKLSLEQC